MPPPVAPFTCPRCGDPTAELAGVPGPDHGFARIRSCESCHHLWFTVEAVVPEADGPPPVGTAATPFAPGSEVVAP